MTVVTSLVNDTDQARTGTIVFAGDSGLLLAIEPCWLPSQDAGFVRFKAKRGAFEWEGVFDFIGFEEMVAEAIEKRKLAHK